MSGTVRGSSAPGAGAAVADVIDRAAAAVSAHPFLALAVTNAATTAAWLYIVSEGHPLRYVYKQLFKAVVAAAPASVVQGEQDKLRKKIESSVIGHAFDGDALNLTLPAKGECAQQRPGRAGEACLTYDMGGLMPVGCSRHKLTRGVAAICHGAARAAAHSS
jgi:hypothetical protein